MNFDTLRSADGNLANDIKNGREFARSHSADLESFFKKYLSTAA